MIDPVYTARVTATGGRGGRVRSADGVLDIALVRPPGLGGSGVDGDGTNPEQLFAAGYSACFHSALTVVARAARIGVAESSVTADVTIGKHPDGGYGLAVTLDVRLPGAPPDVAQRLVRQAHALCPYSRATRGNIVVTIVVNGG
ncbi:organic hydroperoxide resistance protein [Solwaraspora sp. WMMD406]|uniref:organic hydroperoxide resistance protein n=1 Tax=unclassified Solwaraspora TaxID=2627926 RepID=UPI002415B9D9|nr:organic hydroperoxide resistance protein [Solwaraspora sp. WMMD406]MDG4762539.1 organic hydroperoxide resistance protein [Solwaraspora sp. WMMD406]